MRRAVRGAASRQDIPSPQPAAVRGLVDARDDAVGDSCPRHRRCGPTCARRSPPPCPGRRSSRGSRCRRRPCRCRRRSESPRRRGPSRRGNPGYAPPCEPPTTTMPAHSGPSLVTVEAKWMPSCFIGTADTSDGGGCQQCRIHGQGRFLVHPDRSGFAGIRRASRLSNEGKMPSSPGATGARSVSPPNKTLMAGSTTPQHESALGARRRPSWERGHLARMDNRGPSARCGRDARAPRRRSPREYFHSKWSCIHGPEFMQPGTGRHGEPGAFARSRCEFPYYPVDSHESWSRCLG